MITKEEFKAGREANIVELGVLARELGIDVDEMIERNMEAHYREIEACIREALKK